VGNAGQPGSKRIAATAAVLTDDHGTVTSWSSAAEALTGHSAAEMVGLPAWVICSRMAPPGRDPDAIRRRVKALIESILASGHLPRMRRHPTFRLRRADGSIRTIEHDLAMVPSGSGFGLAAFVTEVGGGEGAGDTGAAQNLYGLLFEHMSTAVVIAEVVYDDSRSPIDYRIIDANPAFERLIGRKADKVIGRRAFELRPNLPRELVDRIAEVVTTGRSIELERGDSEADRAVRVRLSRVGETWLVAMIEDVTEARRAEAAIRERTAFAETIIASAGEGLIVYDRDLRYVVWNPVMEKMTGIPTAQVIGRGAFEVFPEVMAAGIGDDLKAALAGQSPAPREFEYVIPATGRRGWVVQTNSPHLDARGNVVGVVSSVLDVTAEHNIDAALRESEEQLRIIFDSVGDAVAIHRPGKTFIEANQVLCQRLGYSREELLTMTVADINAPELRDQVGEKTSRILDDGAAVFEVVHVARDGRRIPVEVAARHIQFRGQDAILSVHRDISERKRAEDATREQARFLQQLVDAIPIPILAKGRDGRVTLVNKAFSETSGMPPKAILGKRSVDVEDFRPDLQVSMDEFVISTGQIQIYEGRMPMPDGSEAHVILTKAPLRDEYGTVTGVVSAALDMTDRFRAEEALRQSEERFRTLFEHASDAIYMADADGNFFEANRMAAESLGYSRDELLRMSVADVSPEEARSRIPDVLARLKERGSLAYETRHLRRDGTIIPIELSAALIDLGGRQAILGIARDISQRKLAEADRASLEDQLRQAQKMEGIGQLAGGIAHDFNNLLTAIRGYASLALGSVGPEDEVRSDLEQIEQAADRAAGLTRQLLAFARRTVLQPELIDLGGIVHGLEPMLTRLLGEDVVLVTATPPSRGLVLADPSQMGAVIVNLALNARDAMPDGGTLTIETADVELDHEFVRQVPSATAGPNAMLSVTDTGTGMDDVTMAHLFEPFYTTKGPGKGTGLGLATVYGIVRQSGGAVRATSELGHGSTFTVYLPRVGQVPAPDYVAPPIAPAAIRGSRTATILVVEDDPGVRGFVTRVLEHAGYRVLSASGGKEAFELASGQKLELLLTDVVMPTMSGREVAALLGETHPGIRVLYVSGHAEHAIVRHGVLEPDINFLAKPFTAEALLAAVDKAIAGVSVD
jgi:PAS domain S-box-containing protein